MKFWSKTPGYYMNRVGLVSSRRTHNFASMWEKNPKQTTKKPTTQQPSTTVMEKSLKQSQVAKKGALTEILASNFTNLSVLKREAPSEADLNQRILLGCPWSPAPIPFVKTRKVCFYKLNTEPWRAAENLTGAWCAGNSCGEKGAHPSAPAVQIPTSSTHKGRERR